MTIDSLKASIAFHEKLFLASLAMLAPLIGWTASNYAKNSAFVVAAMILSLIIAAYSVHLYKHIKSLIKEIEHV